MSFFEDIAQALDVEGIESRVHDDTLFVPITAEVEIQFVEIDPTLPAANVYVAAADVDEDDEEFEAVLTSVVFSVDDAVATVARHVATDQVVTVLGDLLDGTDERIADIDFFQDEFNPNLVVAEVGTSSELEVEVVLIDGTPSALVTFRVIDSDLEEEFEHTLDSFFESDSDASLSDEDRMRLFADLRSDATTEVLDLGVFTDFNLLFDVLSLAADQAESWEDQLVAFDSDDFGEPDVYDIFVEDSLDELEDDVDSEDDFDEEDED